MAKIEINFDTKSIEKAINQIKQIKKKLYTEIKDLFLTKCLEWVRDRANFYLSNIPMGNDVITTIQGAWDIKNVTRNVKMLYNTSQPATFVEFGVGIVGQQHEHPEASKEGYEYNKPSRYKHSDGKWVFNSEHKENAIDLNEGYFGVYQRENSGKTVVVTKGSPANLYLYNAGMDLLSSGEYHRLWKETLKEKL